MTGRRVLNPATSQQVGQLAAQLRELPFGQPLDRSGSRHGPVASLENELDTPVRREAGWWPREDIGKLGFEGSEVGMVLPLQGDRSVGEPQRSVGEPHTR